MSDDPLDHFADVARAMSAESGLDQTLERAVAGAVELVEGCDHAGISVVERRRVVETAAATDDLVRRGDQLQYELNEGPCLQSIREQETVQSDDLTTEDRWPTWSRRAADELGVRSMLSVQLFVSEDSLGALNLYSGTVGAFTADSRETALALAAHVAVAMLAAQEHENYESALAHRTVIGQAQGILMERYQLTPDQAFATLARVSQAQNRKLRHIALDLTRNANLGGLPRSPAPPAP
ncbi:GAF and ANTAR domain-containing protein [Aeromicrobium sp. Marseille-Q0843]|uniref:GAF and ANTAR domain-containing protein n=1 Tax=Aeromicrobium phoceense TaxID=2754045 RepID=A0A838XI62_9ACTN|nr:GAF and ANTAR domain-containing protein [Aeromicrobium phoceense]MBA4609557.1 GAF and ANTAR domain-containing protein [Aeromicrobium phoceense]